MLTCLDVFFIVPVFSQSQFYLPRLYFCSVVKLLLLILVLVYPHMPQNKMAHSYIPLPRFEKFLSGDGFLVPVACECWYYIRSQWDLQYMDGVP